VNSIQTALFNKKFVIFGFLVYDSFMSQEVANNGLVPVPDTANETIQGGHCMHLVGWCNINNVLHFIARNSWGTSWGNNGAPVSVPSFQFTNNGTNGGFCYMPATYITDENLAFEFIAVSK
jgi:hypothetical protein